MPECQNCGNVVTEQYVRVFTPEGLDQPRCCPACPDKIRDGGKVRKAKSKRTSARQYDESSEVTT